jgi:hypothetical protein
MRGMRLYQHVPIFPNPSAHWNAGYSRAKCYAKVLPLLCEGGTQICLTSRREITNAVPIDVVMCSC